MIRKLSIIGGGILLALVLLVVGIFIYIDSIAATAVERGGTYALGVDTRLADADVGIFAGEVTLDGLTVDNPEGFK
ncbi:MAG: hypothetical protein R3336_06495, partial [Phycisphaeraceae bacterium]|nr:hypothetical protein [Phycisphaeraceae bacterium]